MTKSDMVFQRLEEKIQQGEFPDGHLPGERELASEFQVGRCTVRAALQLLERNGLIERHRKRGTIVRDMCAVDKGTVWLVMRTSGHLYSEMHHCLLNGFLASGYSVPDLTARSAG